MPRRSAQDFTEGFLRSRVALDGAMTSFFDRLTPGLEFRVHPTGAKAFALRYRDPAGRSIRLKLGDYPALSLKGARIKALTARNAVVQGGDPQNERRRRRAEAKVQFANIDALIDSYLEHAAGHLRASTWTLNRQRLNSHVRGEFGSWRLDNLTRADVRKLINAIAARGHARTANAVAQLIGVLYRHAREQLDIRIENPAQGLQRSFVLPSRDRTLNDAELRSLWGAFEKPAEAPSALSAGVALALQLCLVTLQRGGEVSGIHERELDFDQRVWIIPAARSKNGREHLVPLSGLAVDLIMGALKVRGERKRADFVFPSPVDPARAIRRSAVSRAMSRLCAVLEIEDASPHDLRRTGATNLTSERIGVPRFIVSHVLGHVSETGGITGVYDRNSYVAEKRKALEAWSVLLCSICAAKSGPARVIELEQRRA